MLLPVWRHRAVSRAWHRRVVAARLWKAIAETSDHKLRMTQLVNMLPSYFEGDSSYVAKRPELELSSPSSDLPDDHCAFMCVAGNDSSQTLLAGKARVVVVRGCTWNASAEGPEEIAHAEGDFSCSVVPPERAIVKVRTVRTDGIGVGALEEMELTAGQTIAATI